MPWRNGLTPLSRVTIYYAFKQSETKGDIGTVSTGWETFLGAIIKTGFAITGTWPMRTELGNRLRGMDSNASPPASSWSAASVPTMPPLATRREFVTALKTELSMALVHLQRGNIAPVDLAQAAIGPGHGRLHPLRQGARRTWWAGTRTRCSGTNQPILDEVLAAQEGDFDADTRWALAWFEQFGSTTASTALPKRSPKRRTPAWAV